jgi:hypothetical protein
MKGEVGSYWLIPYLTHLFLSTSSDITKAPNAPLCAFSMRQELLCALSDVMGAARFISRRQVES